MWLTYRCAVQTGMILGKFNSCKTNKQVRCKHTTCETKPTKFDNFTKQDDGDNAVNTSPVTISTAYNGKIENYIQMYCKTHENVIHKAIMIY